MPCSTSPCHLRGITATICKVNLKYIPPHRTNLHNENYQTLSDCFSEPPALTLQDLCGGTNLSLAFLSKRRLAALSNRLGHDRLNLLVDTIESVLETRMKSVDKVPSNYGPRPDHDKSIPEAQGEAASYIQCASFCSDSTCFTLTYIYQRTLSRFTQYTLF